MLLVQHASSQSATDVFPTDANGLQASNVPERLLLNQYKTGEIYGVYLQDEWKVFTPLTINYGVRYDRVAEYVHEGQASPRVNAGVPTESGHDLPRRIFALLHPAAAGSRAGHRASTRPRIRPTPPRSPATPPTRASAPTTSTPGATQTLFGSLQFGLDGYYKHAVQQIDEGQFGAAIIESPFNYRYGDVYGVEGTATYVKGGLELYANAAYSVAKGKKIDSSQFLFETDELAYINSNKVFLDHDQTVTISAGASYLYKPSGTRAYADMLYGSGLRDGFANRGRLPMYYTFNIGLEQSFPRAAFRRGQGALRHREPDRPRVRVARRLGHRRRRAAVRPAPGDLRRHQHRLRPATAAKEIAPAPERRWGP